ncbi:MAG TPA: efflux RND transporter periplasmic adaptor subunit [Xanthobacteraceae bacterium]
MTAALVCLSGPAIADEVKGAAAVKVQDPKRGSIPELIVAYGTATPTSSATVTESFQRDGRVSEIFVEVGDQFKMGDKLLDFGASPAAVVLYEMAKTTEAIKKRALERKQQLFKQQLATRDDVDNADKDLSDATMQREMYEKIGSVTPSEILTAPFDGVVTAIAVNKGDRIAAGAPLMTLSRTDRIILSVGVEASALDKVKPELPVHLTSLLPGRKPSDGKVKRIGSAIDMKTRQIPVFIEIADGMALSGENFKAGIEVGKFQGWVVPRDSIGSNTKGTFVYQVDEGHAKRVYVNVIGSVGKNSVVEGDIDSQKELILSGNYQVDDGDAVRPEEAAQEEEEEED